MAISDNLVAYYRCSTTLDEQGSHNSTSQQNVSIGTGKYGDGWHFTDPNESWVDLDTTIDFTQAHVESTGYTVSAWIKGSTTGTQRSVISSVHNGVMPLCFRDTGAHFRVGFETYGFSQSTLPSGGDAEGDLGNLAAGGSYWRHTDFDSNTWYHWSVTVLNGTAKYYLNGVHVATATGVWLNRAPNFVQIGNLTAGWFGKTSVGSNIDEVAVWSRTLDDSEILQVYSSEISSILGGSSEVPVEISAKSKFTSGEAGTSVGATQPTGDVGFLKSSGQTGIVVYSKLPYTIWFKSEAGEWTSYQTFTSENLLNTSAFPWADYVAAYIQTSNENHDIYVYPKTGAILYDSTPGDGVNQLDTLLAADATSIAQTVASKWDQDSDGNLVPGSNGTFDIGSPSNRVRDIYMSENSLWVGDSKMTSAGGKIRNRNRIKNKVPKWLSDRGVTPADAQAAFPGYSDISQMTVANWMTLAKQQPDGSSATPNDVFDASEDFDTDRDWEDYIFIDNPTAGDLTINSSTGQTATLSEIRDAIDNQITTNAAAIAAIDTSGIATNAAAIAAIDTSGIATNAAAIAAIDAAPTSFTDSNGNANFSIEQVGDPDAGIRYLKVGADTTPGHDYSGRNSVLLLQGGLPEYNSGMVMLQGTVAIRDKDQNLQITDVATSINDNTSNITTNTDAILSNDRNYMLYPSDVTQGAANPENRMLLMSGGGTLYGKSEDITLTTDNGGGLYVNYAKPNGSVDADLRVDGKKLSVKDTITLLELVKAATEQANDFAHFQALMSLAFANWDPSI